MNIKNLERAAEIYSQLPKLEEARRMLSDSESFMMVYRGDSAVELPGALKFNVLAAVNFEINKMKDEIDGL